MKFRKLIAIPALGLILLISFGLPEKVSAQDLEPRRWSHLPIGQTIMGVGYVYAEADIFGSSGKFVGKNITDSL